MTETYFQENGRKLHIVGNERFELYGEDAIGWVESGHLDVFVSKLDHQGQPVGRQRFVTAFEKNEFFFCNQNLCLETGFLAKAAEDTVIYILPLADVIDPPIAALGDCLDKWAKAVGCFIGPHINCKADIYLQQKTRQVDFIAHKPQRLAATSHTLLWLSCPEGLQDILIPDHFPITFDYHFPVILCQHHVLEVTSTLSETVPLLSSEELIEKYGFQKTFNAISTFSALHCHKKIETLDAEIAKYFKYQKNFDIKKWHQSIGYLAKLIDPTCEDKVSPVSGNDYLLVTLERVLKTIGVDFVPPEILEYQSDEPPLALVSKANNVRFHEIKLREKWYESEAMPMLGYREEDNMPVALVPSKNKNIQAFFPDGTSSIVISEKNYNQFATKAFIFFKPLPNYSLTVPELLKIAAEACRQESKIIITSGLLAAIIGLLTPIITSEVMNEVVPSNDLGYLYQITLGLVVAAVASTIFEIFQAVALMRVNFKGESAIQPGIWDRLLKLPLTFFRRYSAGDLANRANSAIDVTNQLKGTIISTALGGIFASVNFMVMFHFDAKLAFCGLGLALVAVLVIGGLAWGQYQAALQLFDVQGQISGMILQFTTGISKLKAAGAEWRAYEQWSRMFTEQKRLDYKSKRFSALQETFSKFFDPVSKMIIIALLLYHWEGIFDGGAYAAFSSAMGMFISAILSTATVMQFLSNVALLIKRVEPIIEAVPEVNTVKIDPGILSGAIEISHASFRYNKDNPLVLKDISLSASPGEFIAIVGNSGSGKSTLFRVLLGFEELESGEVFFDSMGLAQLDPDLVRRQIGVVLQNGNMLPGNIYENIAGGTNISIDDAWKAIRLAGLEDDVKSMAMGIFTVISEGARTFSGGQKQRLMIARALARNPKLLLFDEATSALDNTTQKIVASSINALNITRVIIAHRLSTIMHAHRIYVMESGHITQTGTYSELMNQDGWFVKQASRQLL